MLCNRVSVTHFTQCQNCGLHKIVGVGRALGLGKHVLDTNAFEHGAHCTAGYNTGTFRSGKDKHFSAAEASCLFVGNSAFEYRNLYQILFGCFDTLCNSGRHFTGFAETVTDNAFAVSDNNDGCESESTSTLGDLNNAIDSNQSIF